MAEKSRDTTTSFRASQMLSRLLHSLRTFNIAVQKACERRANSLAIAYYDSSFNPNADKHHPFGRGQTPEALNLVYLTNRYDLATNRQNMSKRKAEDDEWEDKATVILDLYMFKKLSLSKVMQEVSRQGFMRMYVPSALPI
jgi:hypothetical protein